MRIAVYPDGGFLAVPGPESAPEGTVFYEGVDLREPRVVDGRVVDVTDEELAERALETKREARIAANREEAQRRIAEVVMGDAKDGLRLVMRQINLLAGAVRDVRAEAKGRATPEVIIQLDALGVAYGVVETIRAAESAASKAVEEATTKEEIDAVPEPDWP